MTTYHATECSITLPDGWSDQTVHAFLSPPGQTQLTVTIAREALAGRTLEALAADHVAKMQKQLPRFGGLSQRVVTVLGLRAIDIKFKWVVRDAGEILQRQLLIPYEDRALVLTVSGAAARAAEIDQRADELRASLKLRRPG